MQQPQRKRRNVQGSRVKQLQAARSVSARPQQRLPFAAAARVQAMTMGRPMGRNLGQEVKSFDSVFAAAALGAIGTVAGVEPAAAYTGMTEINCVTQGTTVATRVGNKCIIKSAHIRTSFVAGAAVTAEIRSLLVYDRQPNGAFPAISAILQSQPSGLTAAYSGVNIANKSRFLILRDQFFNIDVAQSLVHHVDWYCKGRWEAEFGAQAGAPGAIGDFKTGALLMIAFYTYAVGGVPSINACESRIRYYD
nr:MAG: putative capsid protein [Arizlama virus]